MSEYIADYGLEKEKREYSKKESIYAWFCILSGYLFCLAFPVWSYPFGSFFVTLILFAGSFVMLKSAGFKIKNLALLAAVFAIVSSASMLFVSNSFLQFFAYAYSGVTFFDFIYSATGNNLEQGFSSLFYADFIKAIFVLPLNSLDALFYAIFSLKSGNARMVAKIAFGVIAAIVPTAIVTILLSYDSSFYSLIEKLMDFDFHTVFVHVASLFFGVLIGFCLFSLYISAVDKKCEDNMNIEYWQNTSKSLKIAPVATIITATIPVLVVYVLFFFSQLEYFISGFLNTLPSEFSYAEYAREGFFQLCAVSVINLIILSCVHLFVKKKEEKVPVVIKILSVVYSIFTLLLISTAMAKMVMYIGYYGLTPKRVYASWFMIVLAIVFIFIIIKQFCVSFKLVPISFTALVSLFMILCFTNTDALIAKYNVDQYLNGKTDTIDTHLLYKLGDSGVTELVRVYEQSLNGENEELNIHHYITEFDNLYNDSSVFSYTIPKLKAKAALSRYKQLYKENHNYDIFN